MKYTGEYTKEISFPLGGIGSGCIGLGGDGRLIDWEIFNRPNKGKRNGYSHIAVKAVNSKGTFVRILNGDITTGFLGKFNGGWITQYGLGAPSYSMCGFPHFKNTEFIGEFPIAKMNFSDDNFPFPATLTAFNPFIPLDAKNSSIPGAFFETEIKNSSDEETDFYVSFSVRNPFSKASNAYCEKNGVSMITMKNAGAEPESIGYGDLTISTDCHKTEHQSYWFRGEWKDALVTYWNEFSSSEPLKERVYNEPGDKDTCTLVAKVKVKAGETKKVRFVLTWNIPNNYNYWDRYKDENDKDITWKNYYATVFEDSSVSAEYSLKNWDYLYGKTELFKNSLYNTTISDTFKDAISANLSVLKSPTVLRLEDGSFYGWEGIMENFGACEGTCQHVWNYAYALCFLFPELERSIRDAEFKYSVLEDGKSVFRLKLPYGREPWDFRACVDGQMGLIFKTWREWKISGDDNWLREKWDKIKAVIEYAWSDANPDEWDKNKDGVLEGRQHHTLDMELYGPSSWLEGMYLLALKAAAKMAEHLGDREKYIQYSELFHRGVKWTDKNLFNGEYFDQKIDLKDKSLIDRLGADRRYWNEETEEIKYQIHNGSSIDQMLGQWHSDIIGGGEIFASDKVETALSSMMKYNFKSNVREFVNPWRVFSVNDEGGTVICAYPAGIKKPSIPISYCEETMTGFEYAFAGLLVSNGMLEDAERVVSAVRNRYNGKCRNPWSEIECGNNYARSMASYALLPLISGFEFDMSRNFISFNPKEPKGFKAFWSLGTAWGNYKIEYDRVVLEILFGTIELSAFGIKFARSADNVIVDGNTVKYSFENGNVIFDKLTVRERLVIYISK